MGAPYGFDYRTCDCDEAPKGHAHCHECGETLMGNTRYCFPCGEVIQKLKLGVRKRVDQGEKHAQER